MAANPEQLVRACFEAYEKKDRHIIESVLADDFTFTSPIDDAIDRATYFERCWPNSRHLARFDITNIITDGDKVFVRYDATSTDGSENHNVEIFTIRDGKVAGVRVYFGETSAEAANEEEIRSVIESWIDTVRRKDAAANLSHYGQHHTGYLLAPPLVAPAGDGKELQEWFDTFEGSIGYELRDLAITAHGDTAFAHCLARLTGTKTTGENTDVWHRLTVGLTKKGPHWKIVHTHESVPFLMDGSDKAALDLKP